MTKLIPLTLSVALLVAASTADAIAGGGGNSANVKACQNNGWQQLTRSDGTTFTSQGPCVSYAANGGVLTPKSPGLSF